MLILVDGVAIRLNTWGVGVYPKNEAGSDRQRPYCCLGTNAPTHEDVFEATQFDNGQHNKSTLEVYVKNDAKLSWKLLSNCINNRQNWC